MSNNALVTQITQAHTSINVMCEQLVAISDGLCYLDVSTLEIDAAIVQVEKAAEGLAMLLAMLGSRVA